MPDASTGAREAIAALITARADRQHRQARLYSKLAERASALAGACQILADHIAAGGRVDFTRAIMLCESPEPAPETIVALVEQAASPVPEGSSTSPEAGFW